MSLTDSPLSESQIEGLRQRASVFERSTEVTRDDMSLAFEPTWAADLELLVDKARQGVTVRLVVDDQGSMPWSLSRDMYRDLADAGVEIVVNQGFRPIAKRGLVGGDLVRRSNLGAWATPITASPSSSTAASAMSVGPSSRSTSRRASSTTSSYA